MPTKPPVAAPVQESQPRVQESQPPVQESQPPVQESQATVREERPPEQGRRPEQVAPRVARARQPPVKVRPRAAPSLGLGARRRAPSWAAVRPGPTER